MKNKTYIITLDEYIDIVDYDPEDEAMLGPEDMGLTELVYCKDCDNKCVETLDNLDAQEKEVLWCYEHSIEVKPYDYCSWSAKKVNNEEL